MRKVFLLLFLFTFSLSLHATNTTSGYAWDSYIDGTVGKPFYYLYNQVLPLLPDKKLPLRILDLGSGSGDMDVDLVSKGYDVTGIDTSARSGEIIKERTKLLKGQFKFQQGDFSLVQLTGQYDLVMSYFSLPYGDKKSLPQLLQQISLHMPTGGILAINFFGPTHAWVKSGEAYGINKEELTEYLTKNHFNIKFFLNRTYDQRDFDNHPVHWDVLDVIAIKE